MFLTVNIFLFVLKKEKIPAKESGRRIKVKNGRDATERENKGREIQVTCQINQKG